VKPRNPPISPSIKPRKFIEIMEKPTTSSDPNFLVDACSYMSIEPITVSAPATAARVIDVDRLNKPPICRDASCVVANAVSKLQIPAANDMRNAGVGFDSVFCDMVFRNYQRHGEGYQKIVTAIHRYQRTFMLSKCKDDAD